MRKNYWKLLFELLILIAILGSIILFYYCRILSFEYIARFKNVKSSLNSIYRSESAYYAKNGYYESDYTKLGFGISIDNNYDIYFGQNVSHSYGRPSYILPDYLKPGVFADHFFIIAVANVDGDPDLDIWILDNKGSIIHLMNDMILGDVNLKCCASFYE